MWNQYQQVASLKIASQAGTLVWYIQCFHFTPLQFQYTYSWYQGSICHLDIWLVTHSGVWLTSVTQHCVTEYKLSSFNVTKQYSNKSIKNAACVHALRGIVFCTTCKHHQMRLTANEQSCSNNCNCHYTAMICSHIFQLVQQLSTINQLPTNQFIINYSVNLLN